MSRRTRGAALLLVMWLLLLLSALVAGYAAAARIESLQGDGLARAVLAREAARSGLEYAMARVQDPDPQRRWPPDGRAHTLAFEGAQIEVQVRDEAGKIDLNSAAPDLLAGLFEQLGEDRGAAVQLAGAIVDWRDEDSLNQPSGGAEDADYAQAGLAWGARDGDFETVAELQQVLGMRADLYAAAAPHFTVYNGGARPDARFASDTVLAAMGMQRPQPAAGGVPEFGSGTYSIDSRARLADGRGAHLSVVVRAGGNALPGSTYTPLRWQAGAPTP